jgi:NADH-quinone oxidoreductase subunit N
MTSTETIILLLPELILVLAGTLVYLSGAFFPKQSQPTLLALLSLGLVFITLMTQDGQLRRDGGDFSASFSGPLAIDLFGHTARWFILLSGVLLVLLTRRSGNDALRTEYTGSLLMLLAGLMICARANDLVLIFAGLELVSIPTYVLLYLGRRGAQAQEATTKYFYLSILSSGLLLYGFSFIYGATGSTSLTLIGSTMLARGLSLASFAGLGMLLVVAGLGFRLAAVPFHFYAPDVYQGTSQANAGLLSTMPKVAGLLVLIRLVAVNLPGIEDLSWKVLLAISLVTMTLGNILALWQNNVRRLFAYSSIAHGGYLLIGVAVGIYQQQLQRTSNLVLAAGEPGISGLGSSLFYVAVYTFATLGAFAVLASLGTEDKPLDRVDELNGLSRKQLLPALALAVFLFSLAGIPPLAGFWGKFNLLLGAVQASGVMTAGSTNGWFLALAIVTVLNAAVAAAYYLRIIAAMFFRESTGKIATNINPGPKVAWALCLLLVLGGGFAAGPMLNPSQAAGLHINGALSDVSKAAALKATAAIPAPTENAATLAAQDAEPESCN